MLKFTNNEKIDVQGRLSRLLFCVGLFFFIGLIVGCTPSNDAGDDFFEEAALESAAAEPALEEAILMMDNAGLEAKEWRLAVFMEGNSRVALDAGEVTIKFADGKVSGRAACNNYNSTYTLDESGTLTIAENILMTRMLCDEALNALETAFTQVLPTVTGAVDVDGNLQLIYPDGEMVFEPIQ